MTPNDSLAASMPQASPDTASPTTEMAVSSVHTSRLPLGPGLLGWARAGFRVLTFRPPDWRGLKASPWTVLAILACAYLVIFVAQRGLIIGPADFSTRTLLTGWTANAVMLWLCWWVAQSANDRDGVHVSTPSLFTVLSSANVIHSLVLGALMVALHRGWQPLQDWPPALAWTFYIAGIAWLGLSQCRTLWAVTDRVQIRALSLALLALSLWIGTTLQPVVFWWPKPSKPEQQYEGLSLTDDVMFAQPELLTRTLTALQPPRSGRVNVYSLTYAPYASQDVFMNESRVVTETMERRFGARGHSVQLVLNAATQDQLPWATPLALRKTITRMAELMDRERDVLFLHLTSHGARSGELAVDSWPLQSEPVTPALLKQWLDEAGVRWRVISISACYSGSWIEPLANDETLVMTAADADHTSYGCGAKSPLTFFGQAMYVDALDKTRSFEQAHQQARLLIDAREKAAGKTDGYSNPQLRMGPAIRPVLEKLEAQQAATSTD